MPPAPLTLTEWQPTTLELSPEVAADLRGLHGAKLSIEVTATPGIYEVRPASTVGVFRGRTTTVVIRPKVEVQRFFELLAYAAGLRFGSEFPALAEDDDIFEAFARLFVTTVRDRVLRRGLLQGYLQREESLHGFRGRLRVADQMRRQQGFTLPLDVVYDDFTVDILENRLLKAALYRLAKLRFQDPRLRRDVLSSLAGFGEVRLERYPKRRVPPVRFDRLNRHYEVPVELARLLLDHSSVAMVAGGVFMSQFAVDMNDLFQRFLFTAIRHRLPAGLTWKGEKHVYLDEDEAVLMKPDFSCWEGKRCHFVGDAKYKLTDSGENADLYQLLAYCQALGLPEGMLIYAESGSDATYTTRYSGVRLHVVGIDLGAPMSSVFERIDEVVAIVGQTASGSGGGAPSPVAVSVG